MHRWHYYRIVYFNFFIEFTAELLSSSGKLDHQWTVRWLDDIGLPQYKDTFLESRVDGRMLHLLTVDDLCSHLKVTNLLHLICIRRGIQVFLATGCDQLCRSRVKKIILNGRCYVWMNTMLRAYKGGQCQMTQPIPRPIRLLFGLIIVSWNGFELLTCQSMLPTWEDQVRHFVTFIFLLYFWINKKSLERAYWYYWESLLILNMFMYCEVKCSKLEMLVLVNGSEMYLNWYLGVHGGLLVYEPRFTAELLATLLSIPQSKTLLRRHLATHFNQLLGREIVQAKRDMETSPTHPPLNPVSKVKVSLFLSIFFLDLFHGNWCFNCLDFLFSKILKKSQFTLKRRKGKPDEFDPEDWICPDYETHDFSSDKNPCRKVILSFTFLFPFPFSFTLHHLFCYIADYEKLFFFIQDQATKSTDLWMTASAVLHYNQRWPLRGSLGCNFVIALCALSIHYVLFD